MDISNTTFDSNNDDIINRIVRIYDSATPEEQSLLYKIVQEIAEDNHSTTYTDLWLADYKEIPVDIDTFIENDLYLGKTNRNGAAVYPYWRKVLHDIFDTGNKYQEVMLTGATRIGKTSTAVTAAHYMLYRLMCLKDPQKFFNKKEMSKFSILFFNVTKELAGSVAFREYNDTLKLSPWFCEHGTFSNSERDFVYIPEGGKIVIEYGSDASHGLGKQIYCAVADEANFSHASIKDVSKSKARMQATYNTIVARVRGTFRQEGQVFGKVFAVSSKRSDSDFLEFYIEQQMLAGAQDHMYVSDKPQWEVLPSSMFNKERFYIAVGDRHKRGFVIPDNQCGEDALQELRDQGYTLLTPPIDMRPEFVADFDIALRDLAGISVVGTLSFITQDSLTACIGTRRNPFLHDILEIGTKDTYTIEEFFHQDLVELTLKHCPMYLHLDLSLNTDRSGISGIVQSGRLTIETENNKTVSMPKFSHIFSVAIQAPRGDKIPYAKITAFICWLRKSGFNIQGISRDQFQSEYMAQLLEAQGFDVKKLSLDRTSDGYDALRSVLLEHRMDMLDCKLLQDELIHLQRNAATGRIDHPVGGCFVADTYISLVGEADMTIRKLVEDSAHTHYVYTVNEITQSIEVKPIVKAFFTKQVNKILQITLDNNKIIECTLDHRFLLNDGIYEAAQNLTTQSAFIFTSNRIRSLHVVDKLVDVYDLEIQDNHNFKLSAGLFVHNSKDVADSFGGSVWNAILSNPEDSVPMRNALAAAALVNLRPAPNSKASSLGNAFADIFKNK